VFNLIAEILRNVVQNSKLFYEFKIRWKFHFISWFSLYLEFHSVLWKPIWLTETNVVCPTYRTRSSGLGHQMVLVLILKGNSMRKFLYSQEHYYCFIEKKQKNWKNSNQKYTKIWPERGKTKGEVERGMKEREKQGYLKWRLSIENILQVNKNK